MVNTPLSLGVLHRGGGVSFLGSQGSISGTGTQGSTQGSSFQREIGRIDTLEASRWR